MMHDIKFKTKKFKFIDDSDPYDKRYNRHWSRSYEYKFVTDYINENKTIKLPVIHNTSWGAPHLENYEDLKEKSCHHRMFRADLDRLGPTLHSEYIIPQDDHLGSFYYDITHEPPKEMREAFDFVVNVSTMEHLPSDQWQEIMMNLILQVKKGGSLIMSFDSKHWPQGVLSPPLEDEEGTVLELNYDQYESFNNMKQHQLWNNESRKFLEEFVGQKCLIKYPLINGYSSYTRTEKSLVNFWLHSIFLVLERE